MMDLRKIALGGAALSALCSAAQAGELRGTYVAIESGAGWVDGQSLRQSFTTTGGSTVTTLAGDFETGFAAMATVGYAFSNGLRAELEAGYRDNSFDRLATTGGSTVSPAGDLGEFTVMANLLYDFQLSTRLSLSIGAGAGVDRAELDVAGLAFKDDDWVFAYQGLAGLNYALSERTQIFLNYRYLHADAPGYTAFLGGAPAVTQHVAFLGDLEKHAVTLGLRFGLGGEEPAPPAPPPPPPPPPPEPPIPTQFIVFFGFDEAKLSDEALRVIADAADAAKRLGSAAISIVGHTDSSGSTRYNQALSERRANAVKNELVRLGFAAGDIAAGGKGESELIVKTADGIKEPQNRRATIDLE